MNCREKWPANIIDTHIHLFERPYCDLFDNSHIKDGEEGEFHLYEQYRQKFGVTDAFVIGYEDGHCPQNNGYVLDLGRRFEWVHPFGYLCAEPSEMAVKAKKLIGDGHFGLSMFPDCNGSLEWLNSRTLYGFWKYIEDRQIVLSLNISASQCGSLYDVLHGFQEAPVIISHLGRPKVIGGRLDEKDYAPMLSLAEFNHVYIKLSGFYAYVTDGWRYPQMDLFCVIDRLKEVFGSRKLLFASDFSPVLEYNTYRQTMEFLAGEYKRFTREETEDVYYNNAKHILNHKK